MMEISIKGGGHDHSIIELLFFVWVLNDAKMHLKKFSPWGGPPD